MSQNENILNIKSKRLELDLGNYSPVKIFYIKDKIYVSVTDLQTLYLYLESFLVPISGGTPAEHGMMPLVK